MIVVRVETQSQTEALSIVPIQVCLPLSQITTVPEIEPTPVPEIEPTPAKSPSEKINEETTKSNPAQEDAAALMMMARTASYIPKEGPMPSFSLGLTDSSQEEAATQEGAATQEEKRAKTPETPKLIEQLGELVEKVAGSGEKTEDGNTNEYDAVCTLIAQDKYILSKLHFVSLQADTHIEVENMAIENHPEGVFLQPKTNNPFRVEDYPMVIPFLDLKKLASHRYLEIIQPENDKREKYEWDNWTQDEVDHYRVEYASRILFHEMNQDKAEAIRGSNTIRLSKPSSLLLSPYCQIDSNDIDTD
ncbi:hypothetical protein Ahy_B03g064072 [Arachis hypogaea]|uniref:Uncharacterized protein n=1 Tax=Arachis hypogaea TaxID=3818 RepID=A0A444ZYT6_ARAHY|nr:hypothetical protein Ahy_B03g064072 [Arachis hypogaea]